MTAAVMGGAMFGAGLWLAWTAWRPSVEPLAAVLARLDADPTPTLSPPSRGFDAWLGGAAMRTQAIRSMTDGLSQDLRVLHRSPDEQAARVVMAGLLGFVTLPVLGACLALMGIHLTFIVPAALGLAVAGVAVLAVVHQTREEAVEQRRSFRHALAAYCDTVAMNLGAGHAIVESLHTAALVGETTAFAEIHASLEAGTARGRVPWTSLRSLGDEIGVDELAEVAMALSLAGEEGAAVRRTLTAKARTIRARLVADAERKAGRRTESMGAPVALMLLGFIGLIGYPAIALLFSVGSSTGR